MGHVNECDSCSPSRGLQEKQASQPANTHARRRAGQRRGLVSDQVINKLKVKRVHMQPLTKGAERAEKRAGWVNREMVNDICDQVSLMTRMPSSNVWH